MGATGAGYVVDYHHVKQLMLQLALALALATQPNRWRNFALTCIWINVLFFLSSIYIRPRFWLQQTHSRGSWESVMNPTMQRQRRESKCQRCYLYLWCRFHWYQCNLSVDFIRYHWHCYRYRENTRNIIIRNSYQKPTYRWPLIIDSTSKLK